MEEGEEGGEGGSGREGREGRGGGGEEGEEGEGRKNKKLINLCFQGYGTILPSTSKACYMQPCQGQRKKTKAYSVTLLIWVLEIKALLDVTIILNTTILLEILKNKGASPLP